MSVRKNPSSGHGGGPGGSEAETLGAPRILRIYSDDDHGDDDGAGALPLDGSLSPRMTLWAFYLAFVEPVYLAANGSKPLNLKQYRETLAYWRKFTGDPPLDMITDRVIAMFMTGIRALPGLKKGSKIARNTIRKHCVHLRFVLRLAGPRNDQYPRAQKLVDETPYVPTPKVQTFEVDDNFTVEELEQILAACHLAKAPRPLDKHGRQLFWQNCFLFDYNVGLRVGSLFEIEWTMVRGGKLFVPPGIYKGDDPRTFPINAAAQECLDRQRIVCEALKAKRWGDPKKIWPWKGWPKAQGWLQSKRREILKLAGIPEERRFGFHGFRKAYCTEMAEISLQAAADGAGHKDVQTTDTFYSNTLRKQKRTAEAAAKLPQPKRPSSQLELPFDDGRP